MTQSLYSVSSSLHRPVIDAALLERFGIKIGRSERKDLARRVQAEDYGKKMSQHTSDPGDGIRRHHDRLHVLTDILLGALWADDEFCENEQLAIRHMLEALLQVDPGGLPQATKEQLISFDPLRFDLESAVKAFGQDPPAAKVHLLEMVCAMVNADGVIHPAEVLYLNQLGQALGLPEESYDNLSLRPSEVDIKMSFRLLRSAPPPMVNTERKSSLPPPPAWVKEDSTSPNIVLPEIRKIDPNKH